MLIRLSFYILLAAGLLKAGPEKNIALKESAGGQFSDLAKLTNGIIHKSDFSVPAETTKPKHEIVLSLKGPAFVNRIILYANSTLKDCPFTIKSSLDIFNWQPIDKGKAQKHAGGIIKMEFTLTPRMMQYLSLSFEKSEKISKLKLHELEMFKQEINDIRFSNIRAENVKEYTAEICWTTDVPTTSKIKYNVNPEKLDKMVTQINLSSDHRVALSGLLKGTDYYYQITVDDVRADPFTSKVQKFRTKGIPLPLFTSYQLQAGIDSVSIMWKTNVGTRAYVEFGDSTAIKTKFPLKNVVKPQRRVVLKKLDPSTLYQFKIVCVDTFKNGITTGAKTFHTKEWNAALNKPVQGSFTLRPDKYITTDPPIINRVNDGNTSYFKGMATSGDVTRGIQQVVIDLEKEYEVDKIWVVWRRNAHSRDFSLLGSTDQKGWTALEKNIDAFKGLDGSSDSGDPTKITITECKGAKMRYVRLYISRGSAFYNKHAGRQNFVQIMEMRVLPVIKRTYQPVLMEF